MWHLLGVSRGTFLNTFFLGIAFLKTSFKGGHPLFIVGFKAQNSILLDPKYKI